MRERELVTRKSLIRGVIETFLTWSIAAQFVLSTAHHLGVF